MNRNIKTIPNKETRVTRDLLVMNNKNDRERSSTKFCSWFCYTETNFTFFSRAFIVDLEHIVGFPLALLRIHLHSRRKVMLLKVTLVFGQFGTYSFWYCRTFLIIFRNVIIFKKKKKCLNWSDFTRKFDQKFYRDSF